MKDLESIVAELCEELAWNVVRAFLRSLSDSFPEAPSAEATSSPKARGKGRADSAGATPKRTSPRDLPPSPRRRGSRRVAPQPAAVGLKTPSATAHWTPPVADVAKEPAGPVLRATLPTQATLALVEAIVDALKDGPLHSEDLRRELNLSRRELAKPLAEALKRRRIEKRGERRATVYELGRGFSSSS